MGVRQWLREPEAAWADIEWPRWVLVACQGCSVAVAAVAVAQRDALVPPRPVALFAVLTVAPALVRALTGRMPPLTLCAGATIAGTCGLALAAPIENDAAPFLLVLLAAATGGAGGLGAAVGTVVAASGALVVVGALGSHAPVTSALLWVPGVAAGGVGGYAVQAQVRLLHQERAARDALAERLAAQDRQRIAREVHDVVAHSLGVTMLHLTAARHALETGAGPDDIDEAVDSLREAERVGRQAMGDIRRTIGLLDGPSGDARPAPDVADLPRLVDEFRAAGIEVRYRQVGEVDGLSPAVGLDLYRVAEESLANVVKHAPGGRADVVVDVGGDAGDPIRLRVHSTPATAPGGTEGGSEAGGRGIRGMRQRVELRGGTLRTGPDGGGWCVEATLPRVAAP